MTFRPTPNSLLRYCGHVKCPEEDYGKDLKLHKPS